LWASQVNEGYLTANEEILLRQATYEENVHFLASHIESVAETPTSIPVPSFVDSTKIVHTQNPITPEPAKFGNLEFGDLNIGQDGQRPVVDR